MGFSTYEFIFIFFPIVFFLYYLGQFFPDKTGKKVQQYVIIFASAIFLGWSGIGALAVFAVSAAVNYLILQLLRNKREKLYFTAGILFNVLFLAFFKYWNSNITAYTALPLGISFYTFQQLIFLQGAYKEKEKFNSFNEYLSYVIYFPKMMSGPLLQYKESICQFAKKEISRLQFANISRGLYLFAIGLFKKTVVSDTVAQFANTGFGMADDLNFLQAWVTALCYTFQIYFDFSGYSDMAVGIARMLNVTLPFNFDSPYQAKSIKDFWNRWHITLGKALTSLIYIPLGGNRKGIAHTCFNKFAVFFISGLWHGKGMNFVIWGCCHGILSVFEVIFENSLKKIPKWIRCGFTFLCVNLLWVLFRADTLRQALEIYKSMFLVSSCSFASLGVLAEDGIIPFPDFVWAVYLIMILLMIVFLLLHKSNSNNMYLKYRASWKNVFFTVLLIVVSVLHISRLSIFVYQNF